MLIAIDESKIDNLFKLQADILCLLQKREDESKTATADLLTVKQSALYLNVSEIHIRKMIERREIKVTRIKNAIRIQKSELDSLIKGAKK